MSADILLSRLEKVRPLGPGRWMARCPAHEDRTSSLSVRDVDGMILVKCFAGCEFNAIIGAAGVEASELFPPRPAGAEYKPPTRKLIDAEAALLGLERELIICVIAVSDSVHGVPLSTQDYKRFLLAANRVMDAIEVARGKPMTEYERRKFLKEQLRPEEIKTPEVVAA